MKVAQISIVFVILILQKGSSAEVITQAIIALEIGYIVVEEKENIVSQCELISKNYQN